MNHPAALPCGTLLGVNPLDESASSGKLSKAFGEYVSAKPVGGCMSDSPRSKVTSDGHPPAPGLELASAPQPINPATGQHGAYWVLPPEEIAKGFVRPLRNSYRHVGPAGPEYPLRDLTDEEHRRYHMYGYAKAEDYPPEREPLVGRFWTQVDLNAVGRGCGTITTMGPALAETYARDPKFYGATFCCACRGHFPVAEFRWTADNTEVGS